MTSFTITILSHTQTINTFTTLYVSHSFKAVADVTQLLSETTHQRLPPFVVDYLPHLNECVRGIHNSQQVCHNTQNLRTRRAEQGNEKHRLDVTQHPPPVNLYTSTAHAPLTTRNICTGVYTWPCCVHYWHTIRLGVWERESERKVTPACNHFMETVM